MFRIIAFGLVLVQLTACVGTDFVDDFVEPELRLSTAPDTIGFGESYQFEARFFNNVGQEDDTELTWTSSNVSVLQINEQGLATALSAGDATISVSAETATGPLSEQVDVAVGAETVVAVETRQGGTIRTTTFYDLAGEFELIRTDSGIEINIADDYVASSSLPGLYLYLTNNPNTTAGALEVGAVQTFRGAHTYQVEGVEPDEFAYLLYFCKPFNVKVGDGEIKEL